jgi:hypothetical protein
VLSFVRGRGLEPPWVTPPAPKAGASANFATRAYGCRKVYHTPTVTLYTINMSEAFPGPSESQEQPTLKPVPRYNPGDQIGIITEGLEGSAFKDPVLHTAVIERDRAIREMQPGNAPIRKMIGGEGLEWAMTHVAPEVGRSFLSHGIADKGKPPLLVLDQILSAGFDDTRILYTTAFNDQPEAGAAIGADHPFTQGGIILVAGYKEDMKKEGVRYVVLGEEFNRVLNLLQGKYSDVKFLSWDEAPQFLTEEYNRQSGEHIPIQTVTDENQPGYVTSGIMSGRGVSRGDHKNAAPATSSLEDWVGDDFPDIKKSQPLEGDDVW